MAQTVLSGADALLQAADFLREHRVKKLLLVHDAAFPFLSVHEALEHLPVETVRFSDFLPNPLYEDVVKGVTLFRQEQCDAILAVGGGSTIDVAKCIKLYCKMDPEAFYLTQKAEDSGVLLLAMPTTAGTGSEATRYAVIYYRGEKQSVTHESLVPDCAILEKSVLKTLPAYQKKCTLLDALCQAIESWWSVHSCRESIAFSRKAIALITENLDGYLAGDGEAAGAVLLGAHYAGRAINLTQTTAAHAMSYKLTSFYHIPHGHAVAVCLPGLWRHMLECADHRPEQCADARGAAYLRTVFKEIAGALPGSGGENGDGDPERAVCWFEALLRRLEIRPPVILPETLDLLAASVNPVRLKNNPVALTGEELRALYEGMMENG